MYKPLDGNDWISLNIDRKNNAWSSSSYSYCTWKGFYRNCIYYSASNDVSCTGLGDGTWVYDLGKTYDNIHVVVVTNADKIELLAENDYVYDSIILNRGYRPRIDANSPPSESTWGASRKEYYSEQIRAPFTVGCINDKHWTGVLQECIKGSNPDGCKDYIYTGLDTRVPYYNYVKPGNYKVLTSSLCNVTTLPSGVKVADPKYDGCIKTWNICDGASCMKKSDGSLYYIERISGCQDGYLTNWSDWKCINGSASRTRTCIPPLNGGKPCPDGKLSETATCVDAKVSDWGPWSECDGSNIKRTRTCLSEPTNGGAPCPNLEETRFCKDGKLTDWSKWTCNGVESWRNRVCYMPLNGGKPCPDLPREETRPCSHGKLSEWSEWKCNNGMATRIRTCIPPINDGNPCPEGPLIETAPCSDGKLTDWSDWKCVDGISIKSRTCIAPVNGGKPCPPEQLIETRTCSDGILTDWQNGACVNGKMSRTRNCIQPMNGGKPCSGPLADTVSCEVNYIDLWDANKAKSDIQKVTGGLFNGIKDTLEGFVKIIDAKIPGKKPCSDWDPRYRDDGTSCWLDTYGRGWGTEMVKTPCPPRSHEGAAGDCYADVVDREDGVNWGETWGSHWEKSDGCSWNRHMEGGMCFRNCPEGYFGRAHERCAANGADSFGVMKRVMDRLGCREGEEKNGLLCYPKCAPGYHAVGANLCEPDGGPGIKKAAWDRYVCPPPGNTTHTKLVGALCYKP